MFPYYVIFSIIAVVAMADILNITRSQRVIAISMLGIVLAFFAGLRYDSPDWMEYVRSFKEVEQVGYNYSRFIYSNLFEPGFVFLTYIVSLFTSNYFVFFTIVAMIAVMLNISFYSRHTKYFLFAVLLYYVHTFLLRETMQIRAGIAAGIVLWSLIYVKKRQILPFILLICMAMSFHLASIVFFVVYFIYGFNWSARIWSFLISLCLFIGIFFPFGKLLLLLPGGGLFDRILVYMWMAGSDSSGVLKNPTIIKQLFISTMILIFWKRLEVKVPNFRLLVIPMFLSVCWLMVWNDFPIIAGRMGTFFSVTEIVVLPMFFYLFTYRSRPIVGLMLIAYALLTLYLNITTGNISEYYFLNA